MAKKKNIKNVIVAVLASLLWVAALTSLLPRVERVETGTINEQVETASGAFYLELSGEHDLVVSTEGQTFLGSSSIDTLVLDGGKDGATIKAIGEGKGTIQATAGGELVMKNLTIVDETTDVYTAAYHSNLRFGGKLKFENCAFATPIYIKDDAQAEFVDCTFHAGKTKFYSVWVADGSSKFENCTFTGYRGLKVHEFTGDDVVNVEINGCTFQGLKEKVGVAIGTFDIEPLRSTVAIRNSRFIDCQPWDVVGSLEGVDGIYEADMPTDEFVFVEENNTVEYTSTTRQIRYVAVINDTVCEIPSALWKTGGNYPQTYEIGTEYTIDGLYSAATNSGEEYDFFGWYLDKACTVAFDGTVTSDMTGHITLYAKIEKDCWTAFY